MLIYELIRLAYALSSVWPNSSLFRLPSTVSTEVVILSHFSQRGLRLIQHVFIFSNVVSAAHGGVGQNLAGNLDLLQCLTGCSSCVQLKSALTQDRFQGSSNLLAMKLPIYYDNCAFYFWMESILISQDLLFFSLILSAMKLPKCCGTACFFCVESILNY